jgi:hypothetical protein
MIWDRERRGPAQLNGPSLVHLAKKEAIATKEDLEAFLLCEALQKSQR